MIVFPNAKINLGLNILNKREDGYHNIASCFYPISWSDVLEINLADDFKIELSGITIPGTKEDNLIVKAYELLKNDFDIPPVHIHLHKVVPIGAGLGGGSADCAFAIKSFNELFSLGLESKAMEDYAGKLGSDCPFFIKNKPVHVSGTGNIFEPTRLSLKEKYIVLVYPNLHISTAEAYRGMVPKIPTVQNKEVLSQNITAWQDQLINDFEHSLFPNYPILSNIKSKIIDSGALYASMTGSGSTIYGIFEKKPIIDFPEQYTIYQAILL